jgi:hypothetical protein
MIRELVEQDHLPDYRVVLEDEMVVFRNRMSATPDIEVQYPVFDTEVYFQAKQVAPRCDVYQLKEDMAELVGGERHGRTSISCQGLYRILQTPL